ncbi:hypothetical protein HK102_006889 [Quaeritorhiza haematococci]|nr:hypothetical protein HK102_006889 [Quaeritorhiza haematococci]
MSTSALNEQSPPADTSTPPKPTTGDPSSSIGDQRKSTAGGAPNPPASDPTPPTAMSQEPQPPAPLAGFEKNKSTTGSGSQLATRTGSNHTVASVAVEPATPLNPTVPHVAAASTSTNQQQGRPSVGPLQRNISVAADAAQVPSAPAAGVVGVGLGMSGAIGVDGGQIATGLPSDPGRDARIGQRRARIEASRLAKTKPELVEDVAARRKPKAEPEQKDTGKAKKQVAASQKRIEAVKLAGTEQVTNVRVNVVARESSRRQDELQKVDVWEQKRAQEERQSSSMQDDIERQWAKVLGSTPAPGGPGTGLTNGVKGGGGVDGPYELHELLTKQKEACDVLINIKNKLIEEYLAELKSKDDEYVKELKRQAEEIDTLLERMEGQYRTFQTTLQEELEQIERAFIEERTELIESNIRELEVLLERRRENESQYMDERATRIEDHILQLESLRVHDAEEYNVVKIKLETDVQVLEQQLQQMRATYQLNTEKLEYNYQVLKKRDEENGTILGAQKRKITRLTDHLNMLKAKINKQERAFQQEYMSLTDDYKRITEQFKELQKKFRHFQIADNKKYREVWKMNEELARELMRKVIQADSIIYEQQLGMSYTPPPDDLFKNVDPSAFKDSKSNRHRKHGGGTLGSSSDPTGADDDMGSHGRTNKALSYRTPSTNAAATLLMESTMLGAEEEDGEEEGEWEGDDEGEVGVESAQQGEGGKMGRTRNGQKMPSRTLKRLLELLCNEAGFLVEEKLQKLLAPLHKDEQSLMKLDSIFKALGVETVEDIEKLASYLIASPHGVEKEVSPERPSEEEKAKSESVKGEEQGANEGTAVAGGEMTKPSSVTPDPRPSRVTIAAPFAKSMTEEWSTQLIHPNEVIRAIRRFVEEHKQSKGGPQQHRKIRRRADSEMSEDYTNIGSNVTSIPTSQPLGTMVDKPSPLKRETPQQGKDAEEQAKQQQEEQQQMTGRTAASPVPSSIIPKNPVAEAKREYWERMANVLNEHDERVWTAVFAAMEKYNQLLTQRWNTTLEIKNISRQNEELKLLLRQYMAARVNDELQVPPTQILLAQAGMLHHHPNFTMPQ